MCRVTRDRIGGTSSVWCISHTLFVISYPFLCIAPVGGNLFLARRLEVAGRFRTSEIFGENGKTRALPNFSAP